MFDLAIAIRLGWTADRYENSTRGEISKLAGREISRDIIASLKRHGLIDGAIRAPQPALPLPM
jgi:hypothetical protein